MEILINENGVIVKKERVLVDPDTGERVKGTPHRTAVGLLNHVPRNADGDPDLSDPAKVEESKAKARDEIKALIEEVAGPEFADLVGRIKAAEDERDIVKQENEKNKQEIARLKEKGRGNDR